MTNILHTIEKWNNGESINGEEAFALLTCSENELEEMGLDTNCLYYLAECFLNEEDYTEWSNYDKDYPNNPYLYGIEYNGTRVAIGYTGIAGRYWEYDQMYPVHWLIY